ncbi:hypothetical protein ABMA27_015618 [Loxostege sticticalis]|uniref:Very-long-chain (3R)-3-hydroxyacyl-CoA dehydratase n=1 Tax=Loxostege sticticalis TaxID=481309 RepID=A0ABR3I8C2_LOXSC
MMKTEQLQKKESGSRKDGYVRIYLTCYNLFQFLGYFYVIGVMLSRYAKFGNESLSNVYENVGSTMKLLQLLQFLEVVHPILGFTRGDALIPFVQIFGRMVVLFMNIDVEPRIQTQPVVFFLFFVWSLIETVRYPFYITQIHKKEVFLIKWLRYNLWIPLYPSGFLCEYLIIAHNIPHFEHSKRLTVSLPNSWNFAFHMPTFSRVHIFVLVCAGLFLMKHMYALRKAKLNPKVESKKLK